MNPKEAILLQVHRTYSHDEVVQFLKQELATSDFKIGELKSEVSELQDKVKEMKKRISELSQAKGIDKVRKEEFKKDEYIRNILQNLQHEREAKRRFKLEAEKWQSMYYSSKTHHL
jgi:chromosome segregation ATPase